MVGIQLDKLSKKYQHATTYALQDLSLHVAHGEVYGFLGSNGAGKSTTIRTMMNFLQPTSGSVTILGKDSVRDSTKLKRSIGYLAGDVALYPKASGRAVLHYLAALQGDVDKKYLAKLESRFEAQLDKKIGELSKGNRQKIGILQAFMHQPEVLILDEPTSGLDPLMQERFYETIQEAKARGTAVFLSSHSLAEVQRTCDRVGIIREGKLVHEGTLDDLALDVQPTLHVTLASNSAAQKLGNSDPNIITVLSVTGALVKLQPKDSIAAALKLLSHYDIKGLDIENAQLEEQFMSYYAEEKTT